MNVYPRFFPSSRWQFWTYPFIHLSSRIISIVPRNPPVMAALSVYESQYHNISLAISAQEKLWDSRMLARTSFSFSLAQTKFFQHVTCIFEHFLRALQKTYSGVPGITEIYSYYGNTIVKGHKQLHTTGAGRLAVNNTSQALIYRNPIHPINSEHDVLRLQSQL